MAKEIKKGLKESPEERKQTITSFLLMFPALVAGFIGIVASVKPLWENVVIIALLILQFVLLDQFVKDYYKKRI